MTKYRIDDVEYDTSEIDPSGADMVAMSKQAGMGIQTWERTINQIPRLAWGPAGDVIVLSETEAAAHTGDGHPCDGCPNPGLFTESAPHMTAFLVMVWLARRAAGERTLRFDDSAAVPWSRFEPVDDDEDEPAPVDEPGEAEDPTPPPASAPGTGGDTAPSTRSRKA